MRARTAHLRALAFNDPALLTATANDLSYDQVFALPIERLARAGDLLITISSSGNSPNIVRALETARSLAVGIGDALREGRPTTASRTLGDLNFYVPLAGMGGRSRPIRC